MAPRTRLRICRGCGCDDNHACLGGCAWVLLDIDAPTGVCSQCAIDLEWDMRELATVGADGDFPLAGEGTITLERPRLVLP